jgi:hypothetical protein
MADRATGQLRDRIWTLFAIDACDRAGLSPIPKDRLHRLIFLANCLAELFSTTPPAKRILKYKRGPFYPDIQWQVDRLITLRCVSLSDLLLEPDEFGPWLRANYEITSEGIAIVQQFKQTPMGATAANYIDELVFAFARLDLRQLDEIPLRELNYLSSGQGALISFEDAEANLAIRKTSEFERLAPEMLQNRMREQLQLYLRYIEDSDASI